MTLALGRASTNSFQEDVKQYIAYGWMDEPEARTWTYVETLTTSSVDVYVVNVNEDATGLIGPNLKVRLSNPTVKYFGVLAVGAYADGVTPVYLFGGTDYVLDGLEAITDVSFSNARAPFGFPLSEDKWAVEMVDAADRTIAYSAGVVQINAAHYLRLPQGLWKVSSSAYFAGNNGASSQNMTVGLSTSPSSISSTRLLKEIQNTSSGTNISMTFDLAPVSIDVASETTYYLIAIYSSATATTMGFYGSTNTPTVIRAVWGGL